MRKFKLALFAILIISLMATVFTGCFSDETSESEPQSESQSIEISITLSDDNLTVEQYEQATLTATVEGSTEEVVWTSSNEEVATVSGGVVTAKTAGTTTVTASVGDKSATCEITVTEASEMPMLALEQEDVTLYKGEEISLAIDYSYKNESLTIPSDAVVTSSNSAIVSAEIVEGKLKITAVSASMDEVTVELSISWRGLVNLSATVLVETYEDVVISLDNASLSLAIYDADGEYNEHGVYTSKSLSTEVYYESQLLENANVVWSSSDSQVATVSDDGVVTAKGIGNAIITAKYVGDGGFETSAYCNVTVGVATIDLGEFRVYRSAQDGATSVTAEEFAGFETLTVKNTATEEILDIVEDNALDFSTLYGGQYDISVNGDDLINFTATVNVVNKVIKTAEELINWYTYGDIEGQEDPNYSSTLSMQWVNGGWDKVTTETKVYTDSYTVYGYFELGANIDLTGYNVDKFVYFTANGNTAKGLNGVFDGKGYTVTGGTYFEGGLFGAISANGVVKNLALSGLTLSSTSKFYIGVTPSPFAETVSGTVSDVLVETSDVKWDDLANGHQCATGFAANIYGANLKDVVIVYPHIQEGSAVIARGGTASIASNVYAIGCDTDAYRRITLTAGLIQSGCTLYKASDVVEYVDLDTTIWQTNYTNIIFQSAFESIFDEMVESLDGIDTEITNGESVTLVDIAGVEITVSENGYLTVDGNVVTVADSIDSAFTFDVTYNFSVFGKDNVTVTISVAKMVLVRVEKQFELEVYSALEYDADADAYNRVANSTEIDLTDYLAENLPAEMTWSIGGVDVTDAISYNGKALTIALANKGIWGETTLVETGAEISLMVNLKVITAIITTPDELINWFSYGDITNQEDPGVVKNMTYQWIGGKWDTSNPGTKTYTDSFVINGYFELGANIDLAGKDVDRFVYYTANGNTSKGLNGVFDGKGYTVSGGTYYEGGLFGAISSTGIVKNLALTDITLSNTCKYYYSYVVAAPFAETVSGTVSNVLIRVTDEKFDDLANGCQRASGLAAEIYGAKLENVVVDFPFVHEASAVIAQGGTASTASNVYAIGCDTDAYRRITLTAGLIASGCTLYKASDVVTYTGLSEEIWMANYSPIIFKTGFDPIYASMVEELKAVECSLAPTETVTLATISGVPFTVAESEYVTVEGATITAKGNIPETFVLEVTYDFSAFGREDVVVEIEILAGAIITLEERVNVELYSALNQVEGVYQRVAAANTTIDLSEFIAGDLASDIVWTIGDTDVSQHVTVEGNSFEIDFRAIGLYGDLTLAGASDTMDIVVKFHVVTAFIGDATELINWKSYADVIENGTTGYFELTNNINLNGAQIDAYVNDTVGGTDGDGIINYGFNGIFDGKGYTVYNGVFQQNGLFGKQVGINGVVRNLAMVEMIAGDDATFTHLVANIFYGRLENCLFDIVGREGVYPGGGGANLTSWAAGTYVNVVAYNDNTDYFYFGFSQYIGWAGYTPVTGSRTNVYSIGGVDGRGHDKMFGNYANAYVKGTTCASIGLASKGFDATIWNFDGAKARFNSYLGA